jgi:HK97 family phage portal protein
MPSVPVPQRGLLGEIAGLVLSRLKAATGVTDMTWASDRGWFPVIREPFAGAWQRNMEIRRESIVSNSTEFACRTLIASDIAKLRLKLVENSGDIWSETTNPAYSPVLRAPNHFQNRIQFWETWILSKLGAGNTYVLKGRDDRTVVTSLYVLDPLRTKPLVAPNGDVYYQLAADNLIGIGEQVIVPASEIIHDRFNCLFHPLCGLPPIFASGLSAMQGQQIQQNSLKFFTNNSQPGGILTAAGSIDDPTAERLKKHWEENFGGDNVGKVAILGDGLKYEAMSVNALNSQLIEQLKLTDEKICTSYHVPKYKVGVGDPPPYNNIQALNIEYYSQALQRHIEDAEECVDVGLRLPANLGVEFDIENLLRMDSTTQMSVLKEAVGAAIMAPNEARAKIGLKPVPGGNAPLAQQQDFSLEALAKRDARDDPFAKPSPDSSPPADSAPADELDHAAKNQIAVWALKDALQGELQKMAA